MVMFPFFYSRRTCSGSQTLHWAARRAAHQSSSKKGESFVVEQAAPVEIFGCTRTLRGAAGQVPTTAYKRKCLATKAKHFLLERAAGIEPASSVWKTEIITIIRCPPNWLTYDSKKQSPFKGACYIRVNPSLYPCPSVELRSQLDRFLKSLASFKFWRV